MNRPLLKLRSAGPKQAQAQAEGLQFAVRSFDEAIMRIASDSPGKGHSAAPENLSFRQEGAFDVRLRDDLFLTSDGFDAGALERVQAAANASRGMPVGMAELRDVHVHLRSGIIIDTVGKTCWQGSLLNWDAPVLQRELVRHFGRRSNGTGVQLTERLLRNCPTLDSAILIHSAGFAIYGHWLLDCLPRINRVPDSLYQEHKVLTRPRKEWARTLFNLFAPECQFAGDGIDSAFVRVKRLLVPTTARARGALEEHSMRRAWTKLDRLLKQDDSSAAPGRRLFVSRQKLDMKLLTKRVIFNIAEIERKAEEAGFELICPETLSFAEQRRIFSEASVVLGEDGSGLHNAIFCKPGARLGIITTGRINTNHAMVANVCGLRITYMSASPLEDEAGGPTLHQFDPQDFDAMLGVLLAAH